MSKYMRPCNRYILIKPIAEDKEESTILVPDGYKPKTNSFVSAYVLDWADDVKLQIHENSVVVVNGSMVEEVEFGGIKYHLVLENYILGFLQ